MNLGDRVTLLGAVNSDRLAQLYRAASAFLLSSLYEGLPVTVLEALACGTPVVTTDWGETPKLLSAESGIVCQERTPCGDRRCLRASPGESDLLFFRSLCKNGQPYSAPTIVQEVYRQMLHRWQSPQGDRNLFRLLQLISQSTSNVAIVTLILGD